MRNPNVREKYFLTLVVYRLSILSAILCCKTFIIKLVFKMTKQIYLEMNCDLNIKKGVMF